MDHNYIESLVADIAKSMGVTSSPNKAPSSPVRPAAPAPTPVSTGTKSGYTVADYPMMSKHVDIVKTPTNKGVNEITLDAIKSGAITQQDIRISREMLINQAEIAESAGKMQMGQNLRRAAELTSVPDDMVIHMYDMLRPNRATKQQLADMMATLKNDYNAQLCAKLVGEAAEVYEKRGILLK